MSFDWNAEAEKTGAAPKIPAGKHEVRIEDIRYEGRAGPFISSQGDAQILVVMRDRESREAAQMLTLSRRAAWVLARLMKACRPTVDLAKMQADGVEPTHFSNPELADQVLIGRHLLIDVSYEPKGDGKGEYTRVEPLDDPNFTPSEFRPLERRETPARPAPQQRPQRETAAATTSAAQDDFDIPF